MAHYEGHYSFIYHDAENLAPRSRRHEVHRHIQNQYNTWRRGGATRIVQVDFYNPEEPEEPPSQGRRVRVKQQPLVWNFFPLTHISDKGLDRSFLDGEEHTVREARLGPRKSLLRS